MVGDFDSRNPVIKRDDSIRSSIKSRMRKRNDSSTTATTEISEDPKFLDQEENEIERAPGFSEIPSPVPQANDRFKIGRY